MTPSASRRDLIAAPLLAAAFALTRGGPAVAAGVDPKMTAITPPDDIAWKPVENMPSAGTSSAALFGKASDPGQYFVLVRWNPGFMSAPHWYETDRLCMVLSGAWYCASGTDFTPEKTVPVKAGSFVRRVARTPHYDGVLSSRTEPAIIAISGIGPISLHLSDPASPAWREV